MAPEKPVVYVQVQVPTVNLWPNVVALWPEVLGGVVVVGTLVLVVIWARLRGRRARRRGALYCRRCNYEIGPHATNAEDVRHGGQPPPVSAEPPQNDGTRGGEERASVRRLCSECGVDLGRGPGRG